MLKALFAICMLQTIVLLFLSSRVITLEDEVAASQTRSPATLQSQPLPAAQPKMVSTSAFPGEARLRQIISEELASQLNEIVPVNATVNSAATDIGTHSAAIIETGPGYERRRDAVAQSVDYYVTVGRITEQEMSRLQLDIAKLNPEDRLAMLGAIVGAMNNGKLDGRL